MKSRLNITVEESLFVPAKRYAARNNTSLSQMVEFYFKMLGRPRRQKNVIDIIEKLPKPSFKTNTDLKEAYYTDQKKKHGF
jgi:hypothetical protein